MAATYIQPQFRAQPNDWFYTARMLARVCAMEETSLLKRWIRSAKLPIRQPLALGCEPYEWTCLLFACNYLNCNNIFQLLCQGANNELYYCTRDGMTPLMAIVISCTDDNEEDAILCAQTLVVGGMDISKVTTPLNNGRTVLTMAVWKGAINLVRYLISEGADPNQRDGFGETPLNVAILLNMRLMIDLLYTDGSNPYMRNSTGERCDELAMQYTPGMMPYINYMMWNFYNIKCNGDKLCFDEFSRR